MTGYAILIAETGYVTKKNKGFPQGWNALFC